MMKLLCGSMGLALGLAGCLGSSDVTFYKLATTNLTVPNGTNCASAPNPLVTLTGLDGSSTAAIYSQPNSGYLLDLGNGTGVTGTLNSGTYTFTGTTQVIAKGTPEVTNTTTVTITLTPSGSGVTGSASIKQDCNTSSGNSGCQSANGSDFSCTQTGQIVGAVVPAQPVSQTQANTP